MKAVISTLFVIVVLAAFWWTGGPELILHDKSQASIEDSQPEEPSPPNIEKQFEDALNNFLRSVHAQARDYKKQRKVLNELVRPENLRSTAYVEENYLLVHEIVPDLRGKMNALMGSFAETEKEIHSLLEGTSPEFRQTVLRSWKNLKDKQASQFIVFFMKEEETLPLYETLMAFYYEHRSEYSFNQDENEILFQTPENQLKARVLRDAIADQRKKQGAALPRE